LVVSHLWAKIDNFATFYGRLFFQAPSRTLESRNLNPHVLFKDYIDPSPNGGIWVICSNQKLPVHQNVDNLGCSKFVESIFQDLDVAMFGSLLTMIGNLTF
jgi:hypothetical protein